MNISDGANTLVFGVLTFGLWKNTVRYPVAESPSDCVSDYSGSFKMYSFLVSIFKYSNKLYTAFLGWGKI